MDTTMNQQGSLAPASKLFGLGAEMLGQVESTIGKNKIRSMRIKLGNRVIKEIPVQAASTVVTIVLALVAVLLSSLSIEVEHEPQNAATGAA